MGLLGDEAGAAFGAYTTGRKYQKARERAINADVNTLPDPKTYAVAAGLLGVAPDEQGFSVLHPKYQEIKKTAEPAYLLGLLSSVAPLTKGLPVGAIIKPETLEQARQKLEALKNGQKVDYVLRGGLLTTPDQQSKIDNAFSLLTGGKQPPNPKTAIDISLGHIFDARMSGKMKSDGRMADTFRTDQVLDWLDSAGSDFASVGSIGGRPHLENIFTDANGLTYKVRIPISGDATTGRQWVSGLIPEGIFSQKK